MNVSEAKRRLNAYLQRVGDMDGEGGWREYSIADHLTDANNYYFWRIVEYGKDRFAFGSRFTYDASSEHVDLVGKLGAMPGAIFYGGVLASDEDVSRTNLPVPLGWPRRTDLGTMWPGSISGGVLVEGASVSAADVAPVGSWGYNAFVEGTSLLLRPIPAEDKYLFFRWTPEVLPKLKNNTDELLGGVLEQFHPAVVLKAAIDLKGSKGESVVALEKQLEHLVGHPGVEQKLRRAVHSVQRVVPQYMDSAQ